MRRQLRPELKNAFIKFLENLLSKKFTVFITATALLVYGYISPTEWVTVALAILGVVSAIDFKYGEKKIAGPVSKRDKLGGRPLQNIP